jgi:hypothetical protein
MLQELEGFTYATALDLNMGYYTIRLDPKSSEICTIIFPWGKYSYQRLPMGFGGSADIFQAQMMDLMASLEYVRTISDFQELNKRIVRKPYPIPKISTTLQELEGFTYATALDLNMGYYTIRLDPKSSEICTIIFPWGKYSYQRLPMGFGGSEDIFQAQMMDLMASLEYVRACIDDSLIITRGNLSKIETVLTRLRDAGLKVNATKLFFCTHEIEYLGYAFPQSIPMEVTFGRICSRYRLYQRGT